MIRIIRYNNLTSVIGLNRSSETFLFYLREIKLKSSFQYYTVLHQKFNRDWKRFTLKFGLLVIYKSNLISPTLLLFLVKYLFQIFFVVYCFLTSLWSTCNYHIEELFWNTFFGFDLEYFALSDTLKFVIYTIDRKRFSTKS